MLPLCEQSNVASMLTVQKNTSRTLKENAVARKGKFTSEKRKQVQPKVRNVISLTLSQCPSLRHQPSQAKARKGPPQEVLNRMKARPPGSPQADSDRDPIDFLS